MRILDRYLMKEMLITWLAVLIVLLVIMIGNVLGRSLSSVSDGAIQADLLLVLVGVKSISLLVTLIPLGLYLGIMLAHGRFYRDNEMSVMQACGVGWIDLLRPTAVIGVMGVIMISILTVFASPWAARYEQQLKQTIRDQSALSLVTPGKFVESSDGSTVFFAHQSNPERTQFNDVFMYRQKGDGVPAVDSARIASYQLDPDTGDEYLIFTDGQTSVGSPGDKEFTITDFKRQGVLRPREESEEPRLIVKGKSLSELWGTGDSADQAELQWRVSIPLAALLLALLAVPLSYTSPREGRFGKIAVAILIYIPYANLLVLMRKWIAAGVLPAWIGLWPVHLGVALLIVYLLIRRVGWSWIRNQSRSQPPHLNSGLA
ncbi:MAG: LPS export ABC transporter permease LptF [Granulosicoccus sp.]|nr:LPS export ABC transporter permease LptF [Granulosicoccus sp.]